MLSSCISIWGHRMERNMHLFLVHWSPRGSCLATLLAAQDAGLSGFFCLILQLFQLKKLLCGWWKFVYLIINYWYIWCGREWHRGDSSDVFAQLCSHFKAAVSRKRPQYCINQVSLWRIRNWSVKSQNPNIIPLGAHKPWARRWRRGWERERERIEEATLLPKERKLPGCSVPVGLSA